MRNLLLAALALCLVACEHKTQDTDTNQFVLSDTMMHMIRLDTVRSCNITDQVPLTGNVAFDENTVVRVFARGSGQVTEAPVSLGDFVHKGQTLAVIRSADVAGAYADLNAARADLNIAKRQMENEKALFQSGLASQRDYSEASENYQKALAAQQKIEHGISINGGPHSNASGSYALVAPVDGYVVSKTIAAGDFIRPDASESLYTISDLKDVWVIANVYEADISRLHQGYAAEVYAAAYPDHPFYGKVDMMSQVLDPQSKALHIRVKLDNHEGLLKPDMFARVLVSNEEGQMATCVPSDAIVSQDGKQYVVQYVRRDSLNIVPLNVIKTVDNRSYVTGDLKPGQLVVTQNQLFIFNQLVEE
ncbi:MAG: efflux RND transporter periplasmic adaptor subunit [Bacteroidetes bacterium]|nr:efflux RND transporter periplasmic adaptor subunit [Bacteroidota bacterium]MBS1630337.1 efflux RND transporter periplasmic adaptor subunit [Bacteroidota bacterium]